MVTSTQGEGEPPEEAVALHKFLFSKKAPKLTDTAFAVFGLGDTSYEFFCQSGKDFDNKLAELGGERLLDRVDADVEYQAAAAEWRARVVEVLKARAPAAAPSQLVTSGAVNEIHTSPYTKEAPLTATLAVNQKLPVAILKKMCAILKSTSATPACAISRAMRWASGTRTIRLW